MNFLTYFIAIFTSFKLIKTTTLNSNQKYDLMYEAICHKINLSTAIDEFNILCEDLKDASDLDFDNFNELMSKLLFNHLSNMRCWKTAKA